MSRSTKSTMRGILLAAVLAVLAVLSLPIQARMNWMKNDDLMKAPHTAYDLTETNFNSTLGLFLPNHTCVIEFYASWCPHCHHYAPIFESAARFLKAAGDSGEAHVFVGRIDCAANVRLCGAFTNLMFYPAVGIERAATFLSRNDKNITWHHRIRPGPIIEHVSKLVGKPLFFVEMPSPPSLANAPVSTAPPAPVVPVWTLRDIESATRMLWHFITSTPALHMGADKRTALLQLLQWFELTHASPTCKAGASELVQKYPQLWPSGADKASPELQKFQLCGQGVWEERRDSWISCRSAIAGMRGFTCGLWLVFHTSAARLPPVSASKPVPAQVMVAGLRAFAQHFFQCDECKTHFSKVMARPANNELKTKEDAVMWLWRTHNEVNGRLAEQEDVQGYSASGDPDHPKIQWPSPHQCPACTTKLKPGAHVTSGSSSGFLGRLGSTLFGGERPPPLPPQAGPFLEWNEAAVLLYLNTTFASPPPYVAPSPSPSPLTKSASSGNTLHPPETRHSLLIWPVAAVLLAGGLFVGWNLFMTVRKRASEVGWRSASKLSRFRSVGQNGSDLGISGMGVSGISTQRRGTVSASSSAGSSSGGSPRRKAGTPPG